MNEASATATVADSRPRVVVLARGHEWSPKYRDLLDLLSGRESFDTVSLFQGDPPEHELGCPLIRFDLESMRELGFEPDGPEFLDHCSDLLLEHARRRLPEYDFYVMVGPEMEVGEGVMERLVDALSGEQGRRLDLVGSELSQVAWPWNHTAKAARFFDPVWAMFMPFVALSRRAVQRLYFFRLEEGPPDTPWAERVVCEALGSLFANHAAYRSVDLKALMPGSYTFWSFYHGLPMLHGVRPPETSPNRLRHPVCSDDTFLERHLPQAQATDLRPYVAALTDPGLPVAPTVRERYLERTRTLLADTPPRSPARWEPFTDPPAAVIMVDDDDLPVRDRGASPRAMTDVAGRPMFQRILDRLWSAGVRDISICLGPSSLAVRDHLLQTFVAQPGEGLERVRDPDTGQHVQLSPAEGPLSARWGTVLDYYTVKPMLIAYGNVWSDLHLNDLLLAHQRQERLMTLAVAPASSMTLALDEALRFVADYRPGLSDHRVEAGFAVVEPALFRDMQRKAPARDLLLGPVHDSERFTQYEHRGACWTANSAREAALVGRLSQAHPDVFGLT